MEDIKKKYPGIDSPIALKLLELIPKQQEFIAEQRRKRIEHEKFVEEVFGSAVRQAAEICELKRYKNISTEHLTR